jgi:hypothetical protein
MSTTSILSAPPKSVGRPLLWTGILAAVLGVVAYVLQLQAAKLFTPWYAPALATLGTALILVALVRRFSVWRIIALLLIGAVTAFEWWVLLSASKLPDYTGPVTRGQPFPEFAAARADGTSFTQDNLKGDQDTVLVFFRGHW